MGKNQSSARRSADNGSTNEFQQLYEKFRQLEGKYEESVQEIGRIKGVNEIYREQIIKKERQIKLSSFIIKLKEKGSGTQILLKKLCKKAIVSGALAAAWVSSKDNAYGAGLSTEEILSHVNSSDIDAIYNTLKFERDHLSNSDYNCEQWNKLASNYGLISILSLLLRNDSGDLGVINFASKSEDFFDKDTIQFYRGLVSFIMTSPVEKKQRKNSSLELRNSLRLNTHLTAILDALPATIAVVDKSGKIVNVNAEWIRFSCANGQRGDYNYLNKNYLKISNKAQGPFSKEGSLMANGMSSVLSGFKEYFSLEYPCNSPVENRWFKAEVRPFRSQVGEGALIMHFNITERKSAEAEMLLLLNNTEEAFILLNKDLRIHSYNRRFEELFEIYFGNLIKKGNPIWDYVQPERRGIVSQHYRAALDGERIESIVRMETISHGLKYFQITYNPARDSEHHIFGVFVTVLDVTDKKIAEDQKEFERRDKEALINGTNDLIWSISPDFRLIAANTAFTNYLKKVCGIHFTHGDELLRADLFPADFIEHWRQLYTRSLEGEAFRVEIYSPVSLNGTQLWTEIGFNPIKVDGATQGVACYSRDITERKFSEIRLKENEARLAEAQALAKIGNWETNLNTLSVTWSAELYKIMELSPSEITVSHESFLLFVHPEDRDRVDNAFRESFESDDVNTINHRIITRNGTLKYVEEKWQILRNEQGLPVKAVGTCQDLTERKLSDRENQFKAQLLDTIGQAVIATDLSGRINFWNKAAERIYGWTNEEVSGRSILELLPETFSEADALQVWESFTRGMQWQGELILERKSGSFFPSELSIQPVFDSFGNQFAIVGISNDITARKLADEEKAKITRDLIQRNQDLEQFTFIISHNLRAPAANIIGISELLQDSDPQKPETSELLEGLHQSAQNLDSTIKDINAILQVRRNLSETREWVNFSSLLEEVKNGIAGVATDVGINLDADFSQAEKIFTLKIYLQSIFYNLISNSIKYRRPDVPLHITIKSARTENAIVLIFRDNGMGIDLHKNEGKLFGLYKRFHHHIEGKGMGLFMVKTQVESLDGEISVKSEINTGTEFTITFHLPNPAYD